jgi:hypothetical protein
LRRGHALTGTVCVVAQLGEVIRHARAWHSTALFVLAPRQVSSLKKHCIFEICLQLCDVGTTRDPRHSAAELLFRCSLFSTGAPNTFNHNHHHQRRMNDYVTNITMKARKKNQATPFFATPRVPLITTLPNASTITTPVRLPATKQSLEI